jgi:hypothetical protein
MKCLLTPAKVLFLSDIVASNDLELLSEFFSFVQLCEGHVLKNKLKFVSVAFGNQHMIECSFRSLSSWFMAADVLMFIIIICYSNRTLSSAINLENSLFLNVKLYG